MSGVVPLNCTVQHSRAREHERVHVPIRNKKYFPGRVTGFDGEMLYENETRGTVGWPSLSAFGTLSWDYVGSISDN